MIDPFFHVTEQELYTDGISVPTHKAIVKYEEAERASLIDGQKFPPIPSIIGVVGQDYKLVRNQELFEAVEAGQNAVIPYTYRENMTVHDKISHGGAFCLREYRFPDYKVVLKQRNNDTEIGYRSIVWNSYDGSGSAKLVTGAIDFFCTNGMISGEYEVFGKKHTKGFQMPDFSEMVENNLLSFRTQTSKLARWSHTDITVGQAADTLVELIPSKKRAEELMSVYEKESYERGATVWALYSALTHWSSHAPVKNTKTDHAARTMHNREGQVMVFINSEVWKRIADR